MILRLRSGSTTPASRSRKRSWAATWIEPDPAVAEGLDHLLGLVLSQQAVIDEHAGELIADRAVDERRGGGRVDAPGEAADHAARRRPGRGPARPARRSPRRATSAARGRRPRAGSGRGSGCRRACGRPRGGTGSRRGRGRGSRARRPASRGWRRGRRSRAEARRRCRGGSSSTAARAAARTAGARRRRRATSGVRPNSPASAPSTRPPSDLDHRLHPVADARAPGCRARAARAAAPARPPSRRTPGPPDSTRAAGARSRIRSRAVSCGSSSANTPHSRIRRAISWEYCPPKSRTSTSSVIRDGDSRGRRRRAAVRAHAHRTARAGAACPRSAGPGRPSPRRAGSRGCPRSRRWPSRSAARPSG